MSIRHFSCKEAKNIDMADFLKKLGYSPTKIRNQDYWYLSPFRIEKEASFKVNRKLNTWYDFGEGAGGTIIDFGIRYYHCSVGDFLMKLAGEKEISFSFPQPIQERIREFESVAEKILIAGCRPIADPSLRNYLHQRNIPLHIANQFCSEIEFELYQKKHIAIGFKNNLGGYELRSDQFKGSCSPKSITWIKNNPENLSVFEGLFDFLSFQTELLSVEELSLTLPKIQDSYIILNSLSFLEKNRELMEQHQRIRLFLDRDEAGVRSTKQALEWSEKYMDKSLLYRGYKDLNEYHIAFRKGELKQNRFHKHGV